MRNNFVFLDSTQNYPLEFSAGNSKVELISKGLLNFNRKVYVINSFWGCNKIKKECIGENKGISYRLYPKNGKMGYLYNLFRIFTLLFALRKDYKYVIITSNHFIVYVLECLWMKILGYKIGVLYHELRHTTLRNPSKYTLYSTKAFDYLFGYFCDFILPISHFLEQRCTKFNRPMLLTPILSIINESLVSKNINDNFLYCGSLAYKRIILFILDSFKIFAETNKALLTLVLYGEQKDMQMIRDKVTEYELSDKVLIKEKVPYNELLTLYSESLALLIPLDKTNTQDKARFSQKIAEYTSVGRPIITNPVGEVPYYFNSESAYFLDGLDTNKLAKMFEEIASNKEIASEIGYKGFCVCREFFDNMKYTHSLLNFIKRIYE